MLARIGGYVRAHHIGLLALFIALGGTSYAAIKLPANSVGTEQLKKNAVTLKKIKRSTREALQGQKGDTGPRGATGATGQQGPTGPPGPPGSASNADTLDGLDSSQFQRAGLVQTGTADETDPEGHAFVVTWEELADIQTDGDADADHTLEILNTSSQNINIARPGGQHTNLPPGGVSTIFVSSEVASILIWSADGARSWLLGCVEDLASNQIRCHGVRNRLG